jgi:hypothetical protein
MGILSVSVIFGCALLRIDFLNLLVLLLSLSVDLDPEANGQVIS